MAKNETANFGKSYQNNGNENEALLGGGDEATTLSLASTATDNANIARSRIVVFGALMFTVMALVAVVAHSNKNGNETASYSRGHEVQRQIKSDKDKWKKQIKIAEEEQERLDECNDGKYSKKTLKLAYELPFPALFKDNRGEKRFEASDVIVVGDDVYAVCDNSWAIYKFDAALKPFSTHNVLIGDPYREEDESGYEAIIHEDDTLYVVRESVMTPDKGRMEESYHAIIEEIVIDDKDGTLDYTVQNSCTCEFEFEGDSKGFEGAISIHDTDNNLIILGLCEGNFCSESAKDKTGNGRMVAMKKQQGEDGCHWTSLKQIVIPSTADFQDYSAITINDDGQVAISSQEDSAVWIGQLKGKVPESKLWDLDALEFDMDEDNYMLYQFPKSSECHTVYCNVEGIHWLDGNMLMAVSDKMKSKGKQDFRCFDKDQSVHAFVVP